MAMNPNVKHKNVITMTSDNDQEYDFDAGVATAEAEPELAKPSMYEVLLLNDDYTPMEFVVEVIEYFFNLSRDEATKIMLSVHNEGKAVCGVFTKDIAETKAEQVNQYSRANEHPLMCDIQPLADDEA